MATFAAKVVGGGLNLRATCSTSSQRLIQIPNNTAITVTEVSGYNDWFQTSYSGYTGYVVAKYVQITASVSTCTALYAHTVRQTPSTSGTSSFSATAGQTLKIINTTTMTGWYRVSGTTGTYGTGWSQVSNLNITSTPDGYGVTQDYYGYPTQLYTTVDTSTVYTTVSSGVTLSLWYAEEHNWVFRTVYNNVICYVSIINLNITEPNTNNLSRGSTGFGVIKYKKRLYDLGYHINSFINEFTYTMEVAVKIFQSMNSLTTDGIIGSTTRAALNSTSAIHWSDADVTNWLNHMDGTVKPKQWYMNNNPFWNTIPWPHATGATETIGDSGNSITAMAMVLTTFADISITPAEMAEFTLEHGYRDPNGQQGVTNNFYSEIGNYYDMIVYAGSTTSLSAIQTHLANGGLAIATVTADANQTYTAGATQLVIWKIDSSYVYVLSPNSNKDPAPLTYSAWNGATWFQTAYLYWPSFG